MKQLFLTLATILSMIDMGMTQTRNDSKKLPLRLILTTDEKICVGEKFVIVSRLQNISNRAVIIDKRYIWRHITEKSFSRSSSNLFSTPQMRAILGDNFEDIDVPKEHLIKLRPREYFEDKYLIDPDKDDFFKTVGKYSIRTDYNQYKDWKAKGVHLFIGAIDSNELKFELLDCKK